MRRFLPAVAALVLVAACSHDAAQGAAANAPPPGIAAPAATAGSATVRRIAGDDRYATAAAVAIDRWGPPQHGPSDVLLASGSDPADALAGSFASGLHNSPLFLTERDTIPTSTLDAIRTIGARRIHILGGTASVSAAVSSMLASMGYEMIRHAGADRYGTAAAIARSEGPAIVGSWKSQGRTVVLANGRKPWDALAAAPLAAGQLYPVVLTDTDAIPAPTMKLLDDYQIEHVIVLGGNAAVSDAVIALLTGSGRTVRRVAGSDRVATAVAVADLIGELGYTFSRVALTSATSFADALAAGSWGAPDAPIMLCASPSSCGAATSEWVHAHSIKEVVAFGGTGAVSDAAAAEVASAS